MNGPKLHQQIADAKSEAEVLKEAAPSKPVTPPQSSTPPPLQPLQKVERKYERKVTSKQIPPAPPPPSPRKATAPPLPKKVPADPPAPVPKRVIRTRAMETISDPLQLLEPVKSKQESARPSTSKAREYRAAWVPAPAAKVLPRLLTTRLRKRKASTDNTATVRRSPRL